MTSTTADVEVLAERISSDGRVRWQARRSEDRGRLIVIGVVAPSNMPTIIEPLDEIQLRGLLEGEQPTDAAHWICARCNATNAIDRRWCSTCSEATR